MRSLRTLLVVGVLLLGVLAGSAGAAPVQEAPADVASCGVDEFTGTALDTTRWNTIVRPNAAGYSVSGGQLKLRALTGDMYGDRATAQNLILQDVPNGAWTATTKLDSKAFTREGQQAGFIVYKDDSTFSKFTVINKGTQGRWFEHIFTANKVARLEIGTDTTPPLNDSFPALVSIRVISDGETIRGEYSGDGITWAPIGRPAKIGSGVKLGLYAADNAQDGPEVPFEFVSLNAQSDEFSGTELEKCRWNHIEREAASGYRVANGVLELDTGADEIDGTAPNLIGQPVPAGTWQAETKIDLTTALEGQQAGLLLYKEPANWIKVVLVDKGATSQIEFVRVKNGGYQLDDPFKVDVPATLTSFYLRMRSSGTTATAQYSTNGTTWVDVGKSRDISDLGAGYLGPVALRGDAVTPVTAKFDYVRVAPSPVVPCTANGTPEAGYERLWNGLDLTGTTQAGPGGFDLVNDGTEGCRLVSRGGLGLLWFNTKTYDNFVLRAQFKTADATDNSGIFVRFPNPGTNPQIAIDSGHEIQIREGVAGDGEDQKTGSIYNTKRETARAAKPAGQWNDYEIRYEADKYTITLNGTVVNTYTNTTGTHARSAGYIGLQNHSDNDEVSFRNVRIQPLTTAATNLFTTVGITTNATRANGQIYPPTNPYSLPAEQMPPSGTVGVAPSDASDDVPLRMPDTTGTKPNFAAMRGQVFTLRDVDQKAYSKLHFFGTTSDGGPAGGDFTLRYSDGTSATVNVQWPDWCGNGNDTAHYAIGKLNGRYRANSTGDTAGCGIYHFGVNNPQPTKNLVSVTLPSSTTGSGAGANTQSYLMALTLEAPGAIFTMPDLSGQVAFPDDDDAPTTTADFDPAAPNGNDGWYKGAVHVTLDGDDGAGGSGVEQIMYRIDGGAPQGYNGAFDYATEGEHLFEYRSIDGAGNAETYKQKTLKVDAKAPTTTALLTPGSPLGGDGWYDGAVTVRLNAADGAGSGAEKPRYRLDGAADWTTYDAPIVVETAGEHVIEFSTLDIAGNEEAVKSLNLKVDKTAPTTSVRINGSDPAAEYTGPVRVAFTRDDGDGSGAVETEYRLDGGAWTSYTTNGAFDVTSNSGHKVEYRSIDKAGNVENFKSLIFVIRPPAALPATPVVIPQATPAPAPKPFASLEDLSSKVSTVSALRAGKVKVNVSCQAVDRGTLSLTVTKAVAKKLGLKSTTLARGSLRCGAEGRGTLTLKPSSKVRNALAKTKRSITATLTLRLTGTAGAARDTQDVTLEGKS